MGVKLFLTLLHTWKVVKHLASGIFLLFIGFAALGFNKCPHHYWALTNVHITYWAGYERYDGGVWVHELVVQIPLEDLSLIQND